MREKTIIFDFGGVLLDIDISLTIKAFEKIKIVIPNKNDIHPNNAGIFLALEKGEITTADFVDAMRAYSTAEVPPTDSEILAAWSAVLLPFNWERFEMLDELRKDYRVMLLSNTNEPHHVEFEKKFNEQNPQGRNFKSYFDEIFYSDELKCRKPDIEIYQKVQQMANLTPALTLFVDDNEPNLRAPKKLGWRVLHKPAEVEILNFKLDFSK